MILVDSAFSLNQLFSWTALYIIIIETPNPLAPVLGRFF